MPKKKQPETLVDHWTKEAQGRLMARTVVDVRYLTKEEMEGLGWEESVPVIIFNDGTMLFPSRDDEGNGGGALFGQARSGEFTLPVLRAHSMERAV
jgi:hypothetical protein